MTREENYLGRIDDGRESERRMNTLRLTLLRLDDNMLYKSRLLIRIYRRIRIIYTRMTRRCSFN